jgi:cysteine desulfurase/selenocysteine lyase
MTTLPFNPYSVRKNFPIFNKPIKGIPLIYLDSAASTQKPYQVIQALQDFYSYGYSNVHRGIYTLSEQATDLFEQARKKIQQFIHAEKLEEVIFTRGATEAINLVAHSYVQPRIKPGDTIVISHMEHHANIVPWHRICAQTGAELKVIPINSEGELVLEAADDLLTERTRLLAITHLSNVLGTLNPVQALIKLAHERGIPVLLDGAQAIAHFPIDVQQLDCDFYVFSGHKMYGPSGIGVLYGKIHHLQDMPPWQTGGGMINRVSFEHIDYQEPPHRFEAGTPAIAEAIGLGATIDYLSALSLSDMMAHEQDVFQYAHHRLKEISHLRLIGTAQEKQAVISFILSDIHAHDIATILNEEGIAVRAGHHCAMPLMNYFQIPATTRVSLGHYNTRADIDRLIDGLLKVRKLLG